MSMKCLIGKLVGVYSLVCLAGIAFAAEAVQASPLVPQNTNIYVEIDGQARIANEGQDDFDTCYHLSGGAQSFSGSGVGVASSVSTGAVPWFEHEAMAGSSGGVLFEQMAPNAYTLTLSSSAIGQLFRGGYPVFENSQATAQSRVTVSSDFLVGSLPGLVPGMPATVMLEIEHYGVMSWVNSGWAQNTVQASVLSSQGLFEYNSALVTPDLPWGGFDQQEFFGVRDIVEQGVITSAVGEYITLDMEMTSDIFEFLEAGDPYHVAGAGSDFFSGLKLHMTVLPEPASLSLLVLGFMAVVRRRR